MTLPNSECKTTQLDIRGLNYHVQEWGDSSNPTLILIHGWMDCGATFNHVAEKLVDEYHIIAPDLRGFGNSDHASGYWFADYFADLDELLNHYTPDRPARLIGHSMGGNIVMMYAGIRPERVASVLSLEALGMAPTESHEAPGKYRQWMTQILSGESVKIYPNIEALKRSIRAGNPSLPEPIVDELAVHWGTPVGEDGAYRLKHDHKHRYANPVRYNFDDTLAVWREITARVGIVMAEQSSLYRKFNQLGRIKQSMEVLKVSASDYFLVEDAAHMLHLEQPESTAECVRRFFAAR
ncbi:alpha/beta fold hydrolase [Arenicella xantha]|uniref:Pimeloyl-ACP methyl ester carboxylesterase n=1 Tax=Arenicella xantha TaxID=644221 RepID=A0A395JM14_9GAMM|nr:alpha/beta hydrolase [Arenicella xantha]RBP52684.1 pimeloyl-ACP methyl ester carboxylesterase [Arenicella xantha]